jgi:serine/threonine protein kinase
MNDFETQIASFKLLLHKRIQKKYKVKYQHLFQENIFNYLLEINFKQIIKLYKIDVQSKILIFEYFSSLTLREKLKQDRKISFKNLKNILKDIALSIDFLHENNIAHIEILTPDNDELKNIDIHSYIILAYRIIHLPNQWKSISHLKFDFSKNNLDYSSCSKFFYSLKLEENFK